MQADPTVSTSFLVPFLAVSAAAAVAAVSLAALAWQRRNEHRRIAAALGALGDPVVVPWLVAAAEQGFCVVECCRALGRVGDRRALPLLRARADATDERVRLAAREALHLLAERSAHEAGASGADADRRGQ
jgi:HEAT repeat protein